MRQGREQDESLARVAAVMTEAQQDSTVTQQADWRERFDTALTGLKRTADAMQQPYAVPADLAAFHRDYQTYGATLGAFADNALAARAATDPLQAATRYGKALDQLTAVEPMLGRLQTQLDSWLLPYMP
jgi:hypothetical protein